MTESRCVSCDGPLPPGAVFCPTCGVRQIAEAEPAVEASTPTSSEASATFASATPVATGRRARSRRMWVVVPLVLVIVGLVIYGGARAAGLIDSVAPDTDKSAESALERRGLDCKITDDVDAADGKSVLCTTRSGGSPDGSDAAPISVDVEEDQVSIDISTDALQAPGVDYEDLFNRAGKRLGWDADTTTAILATKDGDGPQSAGKVSWVVRDHELRITVRD